MKCACEGDVHGANCPSRMLGEKLGLEPVRRAAAAAMVPTGAELSDDVPVAILFTKEAGEMLDMLIDTGLFGRDRADVVERLACEKLRSLMDTGWLAGAEEDSD